jgi:hypothetical protein
LFPERTNQLRRGTDFGGTDPLHLAAANDDLSSATLRVVETDIRDSPRRPWRNELAYD